MSDAASLALRCALLCLASLPVIAATSPAPLPQAEAAALLQRMADASRHMSFEGVFVSQHGNKIQSLFVANRPIGGDKESRLMALDGEQREVRCDQRGSMSMVTEAGQLRMERRASSRHFPDLLPINATSLPNWYSVRVGEMARVAGLDCRLIDLIPKDAYRWGYRLCAEKNSYLPLKAMMLNSQGQAMVQSTFAEIKLGKAPMLDDAPLPPVPEAAKPVQSAHIGIKSLPPGYSRVAAYRRHIANRSGEIEHWVFSDGLTYISLFLEPSPQPVEAIKGQSNHGMVNLLTRQVGNFRATVLGDAPWPAVEIVAGNLETRP